MSTLFLEATNSTPEIRFDTETGQFDFVGVSTPLQAFEFYSRLLDWIEQHETEIVGKAKFRFHLIYFNSASMKSLLFILQKIREGIKKSKPWEIDWVVEDDDEFMTDAGESFKDLLGVEINIQKK